MDIANSLEKSVLLRLSDLCRRNTSTPICLAGHDSGYQSSLGSLPYTPYSNLGLETIVDTPEDCKPTSRYHRSDSLAQVLFREEGDFSKSPTSDFEISSQCDSQAKSSFCKLEDEEISKLEDWVLKEEMARSCYDSIYLKYDTSQELVKTDELKESKKTFRDYSYLPFAGQELGEKYVDFIRELGYHRNCLHIVTLVCSYLNPQDLISACRVSHSWCKLVQSDPTANKRRKEFLETKKPLDSYGKENTRTSKLRSQQATAIGQWRASLANIENLAQTPLSPIKKEVKPSTAPSSLGSRIALFQEQAKKLLPCEHLQPCPRCQSPSRITPQERRGHCTLTWCSFDYCTLCRENFHPQTPCRKNALVGSIVRLPQRKDIIGNKASRRNLKRL